MQEESKIRRKSLRIAAPALYKSMIDIFAKYNIHPYDTYGTVTETENGYDITLMIADTFSHLATSHLSIAQIKQPDDEVREFFEQAAEKCKNHLITDYYKMIKP